MENVKKNKKININDEQLEDVSGGNIPNSLQADRCYLCGKITQNFNLVDHHHHKVCKVCLANISNTEGTQAHGSGASGGW
jgi:hypothetical protein